MSPTTLTLGNISAPQAPVEQTAPQQTVTEQPPAQHAAPQVAPAGIESEFTDLVKAISGRSPDGAPPAKEPRTERRAHRRTGIRLSVRVRSGNANDSFFEEIFETANASRGGLFFTSASDRFQVGMHLRTTFPYNSKHDSVPAAEEEARVERVELLAANRWGIAVRLLGSCGIHQAARVSLSTASGASKRLGSERRLNNRVPFSATALVIEGVSATRLQARCSDLSSTGCYVDTLNPFPVGTVVHLELKQGEAAFHALASVNSSHPGMGMGLFFREIPVEEMIRLNEWLGARGQAPIPVRPAEPIPISRPKESRAVETVAPRSMEAVTELVRMLHAKGILTLAEASALLCAGIED